jgi:hypothetical protein
VRENVNRGLVEESLVLVVLGSRVAVPGSGAFFLHTGNEYGEWPSLIHLADSWSETGNKTTLGMNSKKGKREWEIAALPVYKFFVHINISCLDIMLCFDIMLCLNIMLRLDVIHCLDH